MTWRPGDILKLETARCRLTSAVREDIDDAFLAWLADPEVMLGLNMPRRRLSRAQAVRWALGHDNQSDFFLIVRMRETGQAVGFFIVNYSPGMNVAETSVVIGDRDYWGQNIVRETRAAILDFLFDTLGAHKVVGRPHGRNFSSIFNYKAMGFTCEGVLREQMPAVAGDGRLDQMIFAMLKRDWLAKREGAAS